MLDLLIAIPGPLFLLFYGVYLFAGLVVVKRRFKPHKAPETDLPQPNQLTPVDMAFLSGGHRGLAQVLLFELWTKGYLELRTRASGQFGFHRTGQSDQDADTLLRAARQMADDATLESFEGHLASSPVLQPTYARLSRLKLLHPEVTRATRLQLLAALALLLVPGFAKLSLGIARDRPVGWLLILLIFGCLGSVIVWFIVTRRARTPSRLGVRFVDSMRLRNRWMRERVFDRYNPAEDALLQVALFGVASLVGTGTYRDFLLAVRPVSAAGGDGGSGSASGGGDSGGGDSSSDSGGGGGCGGCGGGGGD